MVATHALLEASHLHAYSLACAFGRNVALLEAAGRPWQRAATQVGALPSLIALEWPAGHLESVARGLQLKQAHSSALWRHVSGCASAIWPLAPLLTCDQAWHQCFFVLVRCMAHPDPSCWLCACIVYAHNATY